MFDINRESKYIKPTTKLEAIELLKKIQIESYSRLKGRVLGILEKILAGEDKREQLREARDNYILLLSTISNSIQRKIDDCIKIFEEELK